MTRQIAVVALSAVVVSAAAILCGCRHGGTAECGKRYGMPAKTIEQVPKENTDTWMAIGGVEGTAIGLYRAKTLHKNLHLRQSTATARQDSPQPLRAIRQ